MKYLFFITLILISFLYAADAQAGIIVRPTMNIGLVGYWNFDVGKGGNAAYDMSGNRNHGTLTNMDPATDWVDSATSTGRLLGQALDFDGSDDYVNVGSTDGKGTRTFSFWINSRNVAATQVAIYLVQGSENIDFLTIGTYASTILASGDNANAASAQSSVISSNTWYHVVVTKTAGDVTDIYVNGRLDTQLASVSWSGAVSKSIFGASWYSGTASDYFSGSIDEVRVYNRALSESEVSRLYKVSRPKIGVAGKTVKINASTVGKLNNGLVGHWTFDGPDMAGVTAYDRSGQGNNGTLTNGPQRAIGRLGQALNFDGSNDYVDRGIGPTSANTVSFWVYPQTTTEYFVNLTGITDYIWVNAGTVTATGFSSPTIYVNGAVSSVVSANQWQHIVVTTATAENASNLDIGRTADVNYMEGKIDEVRIYNRALSTDEIKRLYNMGR